MKAGWRPPTDAERAQLADRGTVCLWRMAGPDLSFTCFRPLPCDVDGHAEPPVRPALTVPHELLGVLVRPLWWTPAGVLTNEPSWEECSGCGCAFWWPPFVDDIEAAWVGRAGARTWCSEDCQINAAEAAHERMLSQFYGGERWP